MRGWRIAGIVIGSLVGLLVAALLLAWLLFDPNDYKDRLQAGFRAATGRELRLDGPLSLSVFPWLAVDMGAAAVGNRPGFGDEPFASFAHARLGVRLWPLLTQRRVELGPVRVDGLALRLAVARDGRNNWSDLLDRLSRKDAAPGPRPPAPSSADNLSVASVTLREASLHFIDAEAGSRVTVEHWSLETGRLRRGAPFDLDTSFDAARNGRAPGRFELHSQVDVTHAGQTVLAQSRGTLRWPRPGRPALEVALSAPRVTLANGARDIDVESLAMQLGDAVVQATLAIRQGAAGPPVRGRQELTPTSPRKLLDSLGVAPPRTRDPAALRSLVARANVRYGAAHGLELDDLDLKLDDTRVTGRFAIADFERWSLRFRLRGDTLEVDRYLPPRPASAAPAPTAPAPPPADEVRDTGKHGLDARGSLAFRRLLVAGTTLQDVVAQVNLHDGQLALAPVRARAFGGTAVTQLRYDMTTAVPTLDLEQQIHDVDVAAMLGQLIGVRQLEGRGNATFSVRTRGASAADLLENLTGPFELTVTNGALVGADLWFEIERAIAAAQMKKSAVRSRSSGRTDFDRLAAHGTIAHRTLRNDRLEFVTDFANVRGRGDVDYGNGTLDLDLVARLLQTPPGRLLGVKVSRVQGADIPLQVTGKLTEPKVRPDVSSLLEAIAKDTLKRPFEDEVRRQLEKIFQF